MVLEKGGEAPAAAADALENYRLERQGDFFGYAPGQADLLDRAAVLQRGRWAALLVCDDPESARAAFDACLTGELPPPEETETLLPTPTETPKPPEETETPEPTPPPTPTPGPVPSGTPGGTPPPLTSWTLSHRDNSIRYF